MIKTNLHIKIRRRLKTGVAGPESFNKDLSTYHWTLLSKTIMVIIIMKVKITMTKVKKIETIIIMV